MENPKNNFQSPLHIPIIHLPNRTDRKSPLSAPASPRAQPRAYSPMVVETRNCVTPPPTSTCNVTQRFFPKSKCQESSLCGPITLEMTSSNVIEARRARFDASDKNKKPDTPAMLNSSRSCVKYWSPCTERYPPKNSYCNSLRERLVV